VDNFIQIWDWFFSSSNWTIFLYNIHLWNVFEPSMVLHWVVFLNVMQHDFILKHDCGRTWTNTVLKYIFVSCSCFPADPEHTDDLEPSRIEMNVEVWSVTILSNDDAPIWHIFGISTLIVKELTLCTLNRLITAYRFVWCRINSILNLYLFDCNVQYQN